MFPFPSKNLIKAAKEGNLQAAEEALARHPEDIHSKDIGGRTALHWAAHKGHTKLAGWLIDKGASIRIKTNNGNTVLTEAVWNDHAETVRLLIKKGVDPNEMDGAGNIPLSIPALKGNPEIVRLLIDLGADPKDVFSTSHGKYHDEITRMLQENIGRNRESADTSESLEKWVLMGDEKIAHIGVYSETQTKLTEIFNFADRERLIITKDLKTGSQAVTPPTLFDDLPQATLGKALGKFKELGGEANEDFVLRGTKRLDKSPHL